MLSFLMTSLTRIPLLLLVVLVTVSWIGRVQGLTTCNIPPGTSTLSAPNRDAIDFAITDITMTPDILSISLPIEEYTYTLESCFLVLYLKSAIISQNFLPLSKKVSGMSLSCRSLDENLVQASGTILKYFGDALPKPDAVPDTWYEGDRLVQRIKFLAFPESALVKIRCGLKQRIDVVGEVEAFEDVTMTKIGCPKSHWGRTCNKTCLCEHGGYCLTFEDSCVCTGDYDGATCNIYFGATTPDSAHLSNTTLSYTTLSRNESESVDQDNFSIRTATDFLHTTSFKKKPREVPLISNKAGLNMSTSVHSIGYVLNCVCTCALIALLSFNMYLS